MPSSSCNQSELPQCHRFPIREPPPCPSAAAANQSSLNAIGIHPVCSVAPLFLLRSLRSLYERILQLRDTHTAANHLLRHRHRRPKLVALRRVRVELQRVVRLTGGVCHSPAPASPLPPQAGGAAPHAHETPAGGTPHWRCRSRPPCRSSASSSRLVSQTEPPPPEPHHQSHRRSQAAGRAPVTAPSQPLPREHSARISAATEGRGDLSVKSRRP
eukprot:1182398-Prorocentrum_minimum.AAC.8